MGANATTSTDYGRTVEQLVCYRVLAFNVQGDSPPTNTDCTTPVAPPSNLIATAADPQTIDLAWSDNSAFEEGYEVQRTDGVTPYTTVANLPANTTAYSDVGVTSDITYRYVVRARKDGGFSDGSNIASAAAATAPPAAPSGTGVIPWASTWVSVTWIDNSLNEDGFRLERSTDGGLTWTVVATGGTEFGDQVPSEQEVCYRAFAFNGQGDSPPSNTDCTTPPAAPSNVTWVWVDEQTAELRWTDNSAVEDGYEVLVDTWPTCPGQSLYSMASLPANATAWRPGDWEWYPCLPSAYYVVALEDGGYSDWASTRP